MEWTLLAQEITPGVTESFSLVQIATLLVGSAGSVLGVGYAVFRRTRKSADLFIAKYLDKASSNALDTVNGTLNGMASQDVQRQILQAMENNTQALTNITTHLGIIPKPDPILEATIESVVRRVLEAQVSSSS